MEGLFKPILQFLLEIGLNMIGGIIEAVFNELLNDLAAKINLPFRISFFDEITKLDLFK